MQPKEVVAGKLMNINERKSGVQKGERHPGESDALKEGDILKIFRDNS